MARGFERLIKEQAACDAFLSAYLDDQLDAKDRARLEAQLADDPALRSELEMLRRTVALVRDLPTQPVPRNFILPQAVTTGVRRTPVQRRPGWLAPLLTAATAVVSLLFVAVLVGDLLFSGMGGMAQLAAPAPAAEHAAAPTEPSPPEKEAGEAPRKFSITESPGDALAEATASAEEQAESGEAEVTPLAMEVPGTSSPKAAVLPTVPAGRGANDEGVGPTPAPEESPILASGGGEPPTEEAADMAAPSSTPVSLPQPATGAPTEPALHDTESAPTEIVEIEAPSGRDGGGVFSNTSPWRVTEVALGASVFLLLAATIWVWRTRRR
jgi:hypothetical protein